MLNKSFFARLLIISNVLCVVCLFSGCGPNVSTQPELTQFRKTNYSPGSAEASSEATDYDSGPYRVIPGDVLEFQMPAALRVNTENLNDWYKPGYGYKDIEPYLCRVTPEGYVTLPIIGPKKVSHKTLADIESLVISQYYPKYVVHPPMVVCKVAKYNDENERIFSVMGLVGQPGSFPYPPDVKYNLMEVLSTAGGVDMVADPHFVKIYRQDKDGKIKTVIVSIEGKKFANASKVTIEPGDIISVDHTMRTRVNQFLANTFNFGVGADARYTSQ